MQKRFGSFSRLLLTLIVNAALCFLLFFAADCLCVAMHKILPYKVALIVLVLPFAALTVFRKPALRPRSLLCLILAAVLFLPILGFAGAMKALGRNTVYPTVEKDKAEAFANRKVVLFVPHEDDDLNVLGGVTEQFVDYGSEVYVVFLTNGDYHDIGEMRIQEAIRANALAGVPEDHVIFLGYGDTWGDGPHIYNAPEDRIMTSRAGYTKTYGIAGHPAYHEGEDYTRAHYLRDVKSVILDLRPDVIFGCDYDYHCDHKATSLLVDRAVGQILQEDPAYRPFVLKGYAYRTSYKAEKDFYALNIVSTLNPKHEPCTNVYNWEERVRLPMYAACLSRTVYTSQMYREGKAYGTQNFVSVLEGVINGDKVFWQRATTSLCLSASVQASSNQAEADRLHDFMLLDCADIAESECLPLDNVWSPEPDDAQKSVTVTFAEPTDVYSIALYDNPSAKDNIVNAEIRFDDGSAVQTGALNPDGAKTEVTVNKQNVTSFTVRLDKTEGEQPGMTEIEALAEETEPAFDLIKITDADDNFVYDYITDSDTVDFSVYRSGRAAVSDTADLVLACDNAACTVELRDGTIRLHCPKGTSGVLRVSDPSTGLSDAVRFNHPGALQYRRLQGRQNASAFLYHTYRRIEIGKSVTYNFANSLLQKLRTIAAGRFAGKP